MKTKKHNLCDFVLCLYNRTAILWCCCLYCFRTLFKVPSKLIFFFLNIFKRYLKILKWGALQCNQVVIRNSCACASFSFLLNQVYSKNGKTVYQQWFLSKLIWFIQCRLFLLGFPICLQYDAEFRCCLTY